ncbi:MAG: tRNA-binding protein [Clostridia bacterium]|jgi:tRNA-binding protein|nr:tRNA-binding protein [Clostridia bacterium]
MAEFSDFLKLDIRVGTIVDSKVFEGVKRPAYKLWVDFGSEIGTKKTSAQITEKYKVEELIGKQVLGIINFDNKQIKDFMSEFLVLGLYEEGGVVLITPDQKVENGIKLG